MSKLTEQLSQAQVSYSEANTLYEHAIDLQHRLEYVKNAMPLDSDLFQQSTQVCDVAVDAVNAAWKAKEAVSKLIARLERE
jgi:hypothetical protein